MVDALIAEMLRQEPIVVDGDVMSLNPSHLRPAAAGRWRPRDAAARYAITFWLLSTRRSTAARWKRESHCGPASVGYTASMRRSSSDSGVQNLR